METRNDCNQQAKHNIKRKIFAVLVGVLVLAIALPGAFAIGEASNQVFTNITERSYSKADQDQSSNLQENSSEEAVKAAEHAEHYTLHLTHIFRFSVDGKNRSVQSTQDIELSAVDFVDGKADINTYAYDAEQLSVTEAKAVSLSDFNEDGEGGARIVYGVEEGWKLVKKDSASENAVSLRSVFVGTDLDDYAFVPADVVRFTLDYQYSSTGALAGSSVFSSDTVEAYPTKQGDNYVVEWELPVKDGFRIVMNPDPLNTYLVNPPTGNETPEENTAKLEAGDYNINVNNPNMPVYYSQEQPGQTTNPHYNNQYSEQYNEAWNAARVLTVQGNAGYVAEAVCGNPDGTHPADDKHGASALQNPKIRLVFTAAQMDSIIKGKSDLNTITVSYRRNATAYAVNHWVPNDLTGKSAADIAAMPAEEKTTIDGVDYVLLDRQEIQGRVGALTKAEAITTGSVYEILRPKTFSQEVIGTNTAINLYYEPISPVRVIFDTNHTYIPRQQVEVGDSINFAGMSTPVRTGYLFDGWQYLKKGAEPNDQGEYAETDYVNIGGGVNADGTQISAPALTINSAFLSSSDVENVDGMLILHLHPKWKPATTQVRVVFWTEDLAGGNKDVQAIAVGGNTSSYDVKYADYGNAVESTKPNLGHNNSDIYSNAGSFTFNVTTDSALTKEDGTLIDSVQTQINDEFDKAMVEGTGDKEVHTNVFYTQDSFEVTHGSKGESRATEIAESDGKTTIYVYYTRNVYELMFHYYGRATDFYDTSLTSDFTVASQTDGFSYAPGGASSFIDASGNLNFSYQNPDYNATTEANSYARNQWKVTADAENITNDAGVSATVDQNSVDGMDDAKMTVPQTITIRAKYGADLREVWPVAQTSEIQFAADPRYTHPSVGYENWGRFLRMISWATTAGSYNENARKLAADSSTREQAEPTVMGTYGAMSSEIIADASSPSTAHHLVAYWNDMSVNYYTNNHCYELPDLDINSAGIITTSIAGGDTIDIHNVLYLVPKNNAAITQYGFTDYMLVSWNNGTVVYDDPEGDYYAVRAYDDGSGVKYYGIGRRVETLSTAGIDRQNPSARSHMTRVNSIADHKTETIANFDSNTVSAYGVASNDINDPYQLYFYYDRDRYDIIYMAPSDSEYTNEIEYELGRKELPYGALVTMGKNGFPLTYTDMNDNSKYNWTPTQTDGDYVPVCPDRSSTGTKAWIFRGWALGPSGANMQWSYRGTRPVGDEFAIQGNLRVYAMWESPTYTVDFDYAGGTESGSDVGNLSQEIPANTRYSASGTVPRPLYVGHTLQGWYVANSDGTPSNTEFNFDAPVTADTKVVAKWDETQTTTYSYTVYYISKELTGSSTPTPETVTVDGETWYVLQKDEHKDLKYAARTDINIAAKPIEGYIPEGTPNQVLEITGAGNYSAYVKYTMPEKANHIVRYVLAGTEKSADPTVVSEYAASVDQVVTTPDGAESLRLTNLGYELVNPTDNGTYQRVEAGSDVKWIDSNGVVQSLETLTGENIPAMITYLVQPLVFKISYVNAEGSPKAADLELAFITAPEGTYPADAAGKNPTQYTTTDSFAVRNPKVVEQDGKRYHFSHWSLGDGTELIGKVRAGDTFDELSVDEGTVGNLVFVANWVAEDEPDNGDGGNGGSDNGNDNSNDNSEDGSASLLPKLSDLTNPLFWVGFVGVFAIIAFSVRKVTKRKKHPAHAAK